ncbi:MAG: four helix bundle protein [Flavobacteriia bacterium]|nr:four helix bundle protein [Flavobacteriia bacterium]
MNYEDLVVYQRAVKLAAQVIPYASELRPYRLSEQICACVLSISSNIAEGSSYSSKKDFNRFLTYAKGSAAELSSQLVVLHSIYPSHENLEHWKSEAEVIQRMLHKLKASVENW